MASTKKRAAQSAASVSNAELPAVKDDALQQVAEKPKEDSGHETGFKANPPDEPAVKQEKYKEERIKDSDNFAEYMIVAGTYSRTEGGRRVTYTRGDTVSLTGRQARKLKGSVEKLGG